MNKDNKVQDLKMSDIDFRMPNRQRLEVGQVIKGTVVSVGSSCVFLDIGTKSEASLDLQEVTDEEGKVDLKVGEELEAYIVSLEPEVILSRALARRYLNTQALEDARDLGIPVEGKVVGINKGGLDVDLNGARAFCPISQVDLGFCEDASVYLEKTLQFRITQFAEEGRNIVVSRRALLEEERREAATATEAQLFEGAEFEGEVVSIKPFGAFVDIGGVQGMVHISEIGHGHVENPEEVLSVGQKVRVKVSRVEKDPKHPDRLRVSLSMKALLGDPWTEVMNRMSEGTPVEGKVVRLQPFGAFVEIAPGVDGLIHVSELSDQRIKHPGDVVKVGDRVQATIIKVDHANHRISLSMRGRESASEDLSVGTMVEVVVSKIKPFGLLVNIKGGGRNARGLIPVEETGTGRNANLRRSFPEGAELKAVITSLEPATGKIRLSLQAVADQEERQDLNKFLGDGSAKAQPDNQAPRSLGTFGDLFKKSLGQK
jgi:small subunit ribosomal protein S1